MPDTHPAKQDEKIPAAQPPKRFLVVRIRAFLVRNLGFVVIGSIGAALVAGLGFVAHYAVTAQSARIAFMAQNVLNLLIFVAILIQAFIYQRQRDVMERTLHNAEEQSRLAGILFRASSCAQLSVAVDLNLDTDRLFITIKNIGKITADSISLESWLSLTNVWEPVTKPINRKYETLFPGEHDIIKIRVALADLLKPDHIGWIKDGTARTTFYGNVTYSDGFLPKQTYVTPFVFRYRLGDKQWFVQPIEGEDE